MAGWLNQILVPVDGSIRAQHAARFAGELARATNATVNLLHVAQLTAAEVMGLRAEEEAQLEKRLRDGAAATFRAARGALAEAGGHYDIRELVEIGDPVHQIVAFARANDVDLVVIGSRGLTPLEEILLGSVSERVARQAPCPVTIVH